jgi:hypothetical protein
VCVSCRRGGGGGSLDFSYPLKSNYGKAQDLLSLLPILNNWVLDGRS